MKTSAGTNATAGVGLARRLFSRILSAFSTLLQPAVNVLRSEQGRQDFSCVPVITPQLGRAKPAALLMAAAMFSFVFVALLAPRPADAMSGYLADIIAPYSGSNINGLCANCHSDWGGGGVRYNIGPDYWINNFNSPPTAAFYALDSDQDGSLNSAEWTKSQVAAPGPVQTAAAPNPANNWWPSIPDKDGDGCVQLYYRVTEVGMPLVPKGMLTKGGFNTYSPRGWDIDDNDAAQGCSTGTWPNVTQGSTPDTFAPGAITDFKASALAAASIPLTWTAVGDDAVGGGGTQTAVAAHSYDLRYTTAAKALAALKCGAGTTACNVRDPAHWTQMYDLIDGTFGGGACVVASKTGTVTTCAGTDADWNAGPAYAPLMRAMGEPVPVAAPGAQTYTLSAKGDLAAPNPKAQVNVISAGTTYWLANRVSDGVLKITGTIEAPTGFTENVSLSNIIAVTAGTAGTSATSGAAISSISPTTLTGAVASITVTVNGYGLNSTQANVMVLTNANNQVIATAAPPLTYTANGVSGAFAAPISNGTYNLELRTSAAVTKAAWINAVIVNNFTGAALPTLTVVSPNTRGQGSSSTISFSGSNLTGGTVSFSGTGIASVALSGAASPWTATIAVASNATVSPPARDVTVTTGAGSSTLAGSFTVTAAPTLICAPPNGSYGVPYNGTGSYTCTATGGTAPYTWSASSVPSGLTFTNGTYSGTPNAVASYPGSVTVTDANGGTTTATFTIIIAATAPGAPTIGTITPGNGQVTVTYTAPSNTGGSAITGYKVTCTPTGTITVGVVLTATVTGLTNGTPYTCSVQAINAINTGAASGTLTATPVTAPTAPVIGTPTAGNTTCTVNFTASSNDGGSPITSYRARSVTVDGVANTTFTNTNTAPPVVVTNLSNTTVTGYTFNVTATNAAGLTSAVSGTSTACKPANIAVTPTVDTAVATVTGSTTATLSANVASDGGSAITARGICWSLTANPTIAGGANPGTCQTSTGTTGPLSQARTGFSQGQTYHFRAYATNTSTPTPTGYSADVTFTTWTVPGAPTSVTATATSGTAVNVAYTESSFTGGVGATIVSYTATCTSSDGGATPAPVMDNVAPFTAISLSGLTSGKTYTCAVVAANIVGSSTAGTSTSFVMPVVPTLASPTSLVTGTGVTALLGATITSNGGSAITERGTCWGTTAAPAANCVAEGGTAVGVAYSHSRSGFVAGTTYTYRGYADSAAAGRGYSPDAQFTTWTLPGAPTGVSATGGNARATVSFTAPASDGGESIDQYTATCVSSDGGAAGSAPGTVSPITVMSLTNGKSYTCTVTATNAAGTGAASAPPATATPPVSDDTLPPFVTAAPTGGTKFGPVSVTLSADEPATMYYTLDGSTPTTASTVYTAQIAISAPGITTLKFIGKDLAGNISSPATETYTINLVDLVMDTVSKTDTSVDVGASFIISNAEKNQGLTAMTAASNVIRFYLSTDGTSIDFVTGDILLTGTRTVAKLLAGQVSSTLGTKVTVPTTVAPGIYYVRACADGSKGQAETNEVNNCMVAAGGTIEVKKDVDLVMTAPMSTGSASVHAGGTLDINSTEQNAGTSVMTAASNSISFYLSSTNAGTIVAAGDKPLTGTRTVSKLLAGASNTGMKTVTVPKLTPPGFYYVRACADATKLQAETNLSGTGEVNNCLAMDTQIEVIRNVDLVMAAVSTGTASAPVGGSIVIDSNESNIGSTNMTVSSNRVTFYLSKSGVGTSIASGDIQLTGYRTVPALAAGASSGSALTTVTVPKTVSPYALYYVRACADGTKVQPESDEANNCKVTTTTVEVIRDVDLVMTAVSTAPATTVAVGATFVIDNTEMNDGTTVMSATSNTIRFYLSTDSVITTSDKLLTGTRTVSALAAGASSSASTTVKVPTTVLPGTTYFIGACADATSMQPETIETNNCLAGGQIDVTAP